MRPRLQYEPLSASHASALFPVLADERIWQHLGPPDSTTPAELADEFARRAAGPPAEHPEERWVNFAVRLAEDGAYCGRIEATVHGSWAEIAYLFGPAYWGRGLATEAMEWLRQHLGDELGVTELWAATRPENVRSRRLLVRLGFSEAAALRPLVSADEHDVLMRWCA